MPGSICQIDGCEKPTKARGLCGAHYHRMRRHGDPHGGKTAHGEPERYLREIVLCFEGKECLTWPYQRSGGGYGYVGKGSARLGAHRVVCEAYRGPPPSPRHEAAHSCGNGHLGCVNPRHLSWKTPSENQADRLAHGTMLRGSSHPGAQLTESAVQEIRALRGVVAGKEVARRYGVSRATVSQIQSRASWGWLP